MDSGTVLKKYISTPRALRAAAWILATASLLMAVLAAFTSAPEPGSAAPFVPGSSEKGQYCCFDAVMVSPCLFVYSKKYYFELTDANGSAVIASMNLPEYYSMAKQRSAYDDPTGVSAPPKRLFGMARKLPGNASEIISKTTGLSAEELKGKYGVLFLDTTMTPLRNRTSLLLTFSLVTDIIGCTLLIIDLAATLKARRSLRRLERLGSLEKAQYDLAAALSGLEKFPPEILTRSHIFIKGEGIALDIRDISWIFEANYPKKGPYLWAGTADGRELPLVTTGTEEGRLTAESILDRKSVV